MQKEMVGPMAQIILNRPRSVELSDILRQHIGDYKSQYRLWPEHKKIVTDLLNCRTAHLGGRIERCDTCGTLRITYNSCRNRHCPKCQHIPRERWLAKRRNEILPVNYFHIVFTLPHELNPIVLNNKKVMLNSLFAAASKTLLRFGSVGLKGQAGFFAILHTWDQRLNAHFHLHCLFPGGVVAQNSKRWVACKKYLFNQRALSLVFRAKFMELLTQNCGALKIDDAWYRSLKNGLFKKNWVVSVREPVRRPEHVLEYLARYTHRVAIANSRIKSLKDAMVTFSAKNRKENRTESVTVSAVEFIRRFLMHSLPSGFVRIRHYGFLANRNRKANLAQIQQMLGPAPELQVCEPCIEEIMYRLVGIDIRVCPCCQKGKMHLFAQISTYQARAPTRHAC
jgi:hypothetical protein